MKLAEGFIVRKILDENILITAGPAVEKYNGYIHLNESAYFFCECLKTETTFEEIIQKALKRYKADKQRIEAGLTHTLEKLREIGAIDE